MYALPFVPELPAALPSMPLTVDAIPSAFRDRHSRSHLTSLSPSSAAAAWHARLHISHERLRAAAVPGVSAGTSTALSRAPHIDCDSCQLATARRLPHASDRTDGASRAGERIFADIAGPFVDAIGGYKYFLLCVDDYTRYMFFYPMKARGEAPEWSTRLLADFRRTANLNNPTGDASVETIHTDNGGELVSARFFELMDSNAVARTFSPAHIKQLNGVAERAIGVVCEKIRTLLLASGATPKYWAYAGAAAVDIHNSTPASKNASVASADVSPLRRINGGTPDLLSILPFGCAAVATVHDPTKSDHSPRGQRGINLGRCMDTPGAYHVMLRDVGKVVVTSDVKFNETSFPWRENDTASAAAAAATHVLVLFAGPKNVKDSLAAFIEAQGATAITVDNDPEHAGGWDEDILNDACYQRLLSNIAAGLYHAIHAAVPCTTCSIARFYNAASSAGTDDDSDSGPPPVRTREYPDGLPSTLVPAGHHRELNLANEIIRRTCLLLTAAHDRGLHITIENPADRSDPSSPLYVHGNHGSLWRTSWVSNLLTHTSARTVTFAFCSLGAKHQKYTTLAYSPALHAVLGPLATQQCSHPPGTHQLRAG